MSSGSDRRRLPWVLAVLGLLILAGVSIVLRGGSGPTSPAGAAGSGTRGPDSGAPVPRENGGGDPGRTPVGPKAASAQTSGVLVRGRLAERGGHRPTVGVVEAVRLELVGAAADRTSADDDGSFLLQVQSTAVPARMRVRAAYHAYHGDHKVVDAVAERTVELPAPARGIVEAGVVELPEGADLGWIQGHAHATNGSEIRLDGLELESEAPVHGRTIRLAPERSRFGHPPNVPAAGFEGSRFSVLHVPEGRYRLTLSAAGFGTADVQVQVVRGRGTEGLTVLMEPSRAALEGRIDDDRTGLPVEGAQIRASGPSESGETVLLAGEAISGPDGSYRLALRKVPPSGTLTLAVEKTGYESRTLEVRDAGSGADRRIDVRLRPSP